MTEGHTVGQFLFSLTDEALLIAAMVVLFRGAYPRRWPTDTNMVALGMALWAFSRLMSFIN